MVTPKKLWAECWLLAESWLNDPKKKLTKGDKTSDHFKALPATTGAFGSN